MIEYEIDWNWDEYWYHPWERRNLDRQAGKEILCWMSGNEEPDFTLDRGS